jgi:hypothetical protein
MVRNWKRLGVRFQLWLVLLVLMVSNVHDSVAWRLQGHRVVSFILKAISNLKFNIDSLEDVATWADEIR